VGLTGRSAISRGGGGGLASLIPIRVLASLALLVFAIQRWRRLRG